MKKYYEKVDVEVVALTEDVIVTSADEFFGADNFIVDAWFE